MKQHITLDQIKQLGTGAAGRYKGLQKKFGWFDSEMVWLNDSVFFLTIGQMIEFLGYRYKEAIFDLKEDCIDTLLFDIETSHLFDCDKLCDALWKAVKEALEKEVKKNVKNEL